MNQWTRYMDDALHQARCALRDDAPQDVPIGAVVVDPAGRIIGRGHNERELSGDPTAHAEVLAIRRAAQQLGTWRLDGCTLVVTLEPCAMCAGAIVLARIPRIVIGAWDEKAGATGSVFDIVRAPQLNHFVEVHPGVREQQCRELLQTFFHNQRRTGEQPPV
ncbi:nucleoside deaminase [Jonesia quinghaiensis]|uniref:nucleoside deaminase n=1 Tax=Jonesia quinghaiensis TaxID=262806 RepID=UPI000563C9A7|nr:nucleoside deaminase [Jonesia quinghaiensis]